jgi:hypothetical protein
VIASTAPQIRYPDCYGIDMSEMGKFLAFQAAVALCKERGNADLLREVYEDCVAQSKKPTKEMRNQQYVELVLVQFVLTGSCPSLATLNPAAFSPAPRGTTGGGPGSYRALGCGGSLGGLAASFTFSSSYRR